MRVRMGGGGAVVWNGGGECWGRPPGGVKAGAVSAVAVVEIGAGRPAAVVKAGVASAVAVVKAGVVAVTADEAWLLGLH